MGLLALVLGWVLARTIRIVPVSPQDEPFGPGGIPPTPTPGTPSRPTTPTPTPRPRTPRTSRRPTVPAATTRPATTSSPPWPQLMPSGLPPFPLGWEPYEPPPPAVVSRANALLSDLWKGGAGTFKVEKTAGVWVYYRATPMGEKRGVVAFREKGPSSATAETERDARRVEQSASTAAVVPASAATTALPTLRRGSQGEDVRILQQRLSLPADGKFGPATEGAVRAFQARNGLTADGIVGPRTWSALMAKAA